MRALAARVNRAVVRQGRELEQALADSLPDCPGRDEALLKALAFGMLRWHHRLDWQFRRLIGRHRARRDPVLAALVRCGLFQVQYLRIPDHAAVAATVDAARLSGRASRVGLINALLRRFLREGAAFEPGSSEEVARFSHPAWLLTALRRDWPDRWRAIVTANNQLPPLWLRVNRRQASPAEYARELERQGLHGAPVADVPDAVLMDDPLPVVALPGFAAGRISVQDGGAQLAVELMDLTPGIRVLDACAAPGGKTAHMLERQPDLDVVAVDRSAARVVRLHESLARLGLAAQVIVGDATAPSGWWDGRPFARILLDAPCTATGVIRRHPDIKVLRQPDDVTRARQRQARLLDRLWPLLERGGRLVYATCSVLAAENQEIVADFVGRTADAQRPGKTAESIRQVLPGEANMDGFYYACIMKRS